MNLSDLVHRTAGDNKVAATTSNNNKLFNANNNNTNGSSSLFQQTMIDPSASPSNLFSRQDQQLLFSMPNTDWMNSNMFFNNNLNEALMDPSSITTNNNNNNNNSFYMKQDFLSQQTPFTNQNLFNISPSLTNEDTETTANGTSKDSTETDYSSSNIVMYNNDATNRSRPILPLTDDVVQKRIKNAIKVTGDNVTANNIEDGYIQFVSRHDPSYISDGIDSLVFTKRKFQNVPKTGDITYTTWDIYQLVLKLHRKEIKNWSQLVGQLGLSDMAGRPQFAQRVKRWMHKLKIDSYFDYLLGNAYDFNGPPSTCLNIGNYKKRSKSDKTNEQQKYDSQSEEEELVEEEDEHRIPVLLAGSRKRMRENSTQMIENAQKYLQRKDEPSENEEEVVMEEQVEEEEEEEEEEEQVEEIEEEEEEVDEEDELASSSSSPTSPKRIVIPSPVITKSSPPIISPKPVTIPPPQPKSPPPDNNKKMNDMEKELAQLKSYITQLESQVEKQNIQVNKLIRERDRTERWRRQIISDLARGPAIISDDDEDEEEEEDDDDDDDSD